ncbi:MAG TPA: alpha/beta fold hydrolase, partial [Polyangiaceae bacterium]
MTTPLRNPWIELRAGGPNAGARLFCFHGAGGSAQMFRTWSRGLQGVEVCPIQLPGRLTRMGEPPFTRLAPLVAKLVDALVPELDRPFVFFAHSLGTLVAFEVTRELRRRGLRLPRHLVVAARVAPHVPLEPLQLHGLPDDELVAKVQERYQSIPETILREPELLKLVLKPLRADLEIHETYSYRPEAPLALPITALGGTADWMVSRPSLEAWREHTSAAFAS